MAKRQPSTLPNDAIPYRESELLRRAIINIPTLIEGHLKSDARTWALVQVLFDCEIRVAAAICRRYKIDPDARYRAKPNS